MKALKLYEQLKQLVDEGKITEDTKVIAVGEYNLGLDICHCTINKMAHLDEETIVVPPDNVLCLNVDSYLCECEDIGCADLWVDEDDYGSFERDCKMNDEDNKADKKVGCSDLIIEDYYNGFERGGELDEN